MVLFDAALKEIEFYRDLYESTSAVEALDSTSKEIIDPLATDWNNLTRAKFYEQLMEYIKVTKRHEYLFSAGPEVFEYLETLNNYDAPTKKLFFAGCVFQFRLSFNIKPAELKDECNDQYLRF